MYSSSRFVVRKHNTVSDAGISRQGVRQGDGLSPILFNVFVNDINEIFYMNNSDPICLDSTKLNCLIYADNVLLISESKKGLQSCLDSLATYCECCKLKINVDKTKIMIFPKGKIKTDKLNFTINNTQKDKYKYLGIMLNFNSNLKHAAEHMYNKSIKAIFSLKANIMNYDCINNKLLLKIRNEIL